MAGNVLDDKGRPTVTEHEFWQRDPAACVFQLLGNPAFKDISAYAPEQVFRDPEQIERIYDEMWTADWWWDMQVQTRKHCSLWRIHTDSISEKDAQRRHNCADHPFV